MAQTQRVLTDMGSLTPGAASPVQSVEPGTLVSSRCGGRSKTPSRPAVNGMVRPIGVTIIGVLMLIEAAFLALGAGVYAVLAIDLLKLLNQERWARNRVRLRLPPSIDRLPLERLGSKV